MGTRELAMGMIPYGTVFLVEPDETPEEQRRDLENIIKLNFNAVVLWPVMSRWDSNPPGETAFGSIDRVMDFCAELGLKAILEVQGQQENHQEAPECYHLLEGQPMLNHPEYRTFTLRYLKEVAVHFRGHPSLLAYDVYNECRYHSTDIWTICEFINFLKVLYHGNIQELNHAWRTFFTDFDAIQHLPPQYDIYNWISIIAQRDWLRFRQQNFSDRIREWVAAVREVDPDVIVLADVLGSDTIHNRSAIEYGTNDWKIAEPVQVLGLSCWANYMGSEWWRKEAYNWAQWWRTGLAAGRGKQVIISEFMTQNRTMFPLEGSSMTDQHRLWSYQAIFSGIKGLIYWKYRPFRRGNQVAGRGLTDFAGEPHDHARQAAEVAAFTARHQDELIESVPDNAGCAILHDHNAQDIYQAIQPSLPEFYTAAHRGIFRGFWRYGVSPAYLLPEDLAKGVPEWVQVLAIPANVSLSQVTADGLAGFVRRGGRLFTESRFALLDEDGTLWSHVPGGGLYQTFGVEEVNFTSRFNDALYAGGETLVFLQDYCQELKLAEGIDILLRTSEGIPALVSSRTGKGMYVHVPFLLGEKIYREIPGAMAVFAEVFKSLRQALLPVVPVLEKGSLVDVSVLLKKDRLPLLVGITNYEETPSTVRLGWKQTPHALEGDPNAVVELVGNELQVRVSARRAVAVFL